ncbi:hypothetical protein, partial [Xanthomonas fragariae]|uniref:hypothetical protein n=1 Tax=Xanthomonas fragariae TaxID=48664 RepID=UPI001F37FF6F
MRYYASYVARAIDGFRASSVGAVLAGCSRVIAHLQGQIQVCSIVGAGQVHPTQFLDDCTQRIQE